MNIIWRWISSGDECRPAMRWQGVFHPATRSPFVCGKSDEARCWRLRLPTRRFRSRAIVRYSRSVDPYYPTRHKSLPHYDASLMTTSACPTHTAALGHACCGGRCKAWQSTAVLQQGLQPCRRRRRRCCPLSRVDWPERLMRRVVSETSACPAHGCCPRVEEWLSWGRHHSCPWLLVLHRSQRWRRVASTSRHGRSEWR